MATIIDITRQRTEKTSLQKAMLKKYAKPGRNPKKAIDTMYGLWEGENITFESIRGTKRRKKW